MTQAPRMETAEPRMADSRNAGEFLRPKRRMADRTWQAKAYPPMTMAQSASREPWHAVSVVGGGGACAAAAAVSGKRFLAAEAPRIPLPKCTTPNRCKCAYRHFPDRRTLQRRASDRGMHGKHFGHDRREKRGRRAEDLAER